MLLKYVKISNHKQLNQSYLKFQGKIKVSTGISKTLKFHYEDHSILRKFLYSKPIWKNTIISSFIIYFHCLSNTSPPFSLKRPLVKSSKGHLNTVTGLYMNPGKGHAFKVIFSS